MANEFRLAFERVRSRVGEQRWLKMTIPEVADEIDRELHAVGCESTDNQVEQKRTSQLTSP
jgi:hypothetical protein